jgi:hypothetical protein
LARGAVVMHRVFVDNIRGEVLQSAGIMMVETNAIHHYTADALIQLLPTQRNGKFVAETVPDFAAKTMFHDIQAASPGYDHREEIYVKAGRDQIASLSQSFNRMRESLTHATTMMTR